VRTDASRKVRRQGFYVGVAASLGGAVVVAVFYGIWQVFGELIEPLREGYLSVFSLCYSEA